MRGNVKYCQLIAVGHHSPMKVGSWIEKQFYQALHIIQPEDCELIASTKATDYWPREVVFLVHNFEALCAIIDGGYSLIGFKALVFVTPEVVGFYNNPLLFWLDHRPRKGPYWPPWPFDKEKFPRLLDLILPVQIIGQSMLEIMRSPPRFEPELEDSIALQEIEERFSCPVPPEECDDEICEELVEIDREFSVRDTSWKRKDSNKFLTELFSRERRLQIATLLAPQWRKPSWMKSFQISLWGTIDEVLARMKLVYPREKFEVLAQKLLETVFNYQLEWITYRFYNKVTAKELAGNDEDLKKKFVLMRKWMDSPPGIRLEGAYRDILLTHKRRSWGSVIVHHNVSPIDLHLLLSYLPPSDSLAKEYHPLDSKIDHYEVELVSDTARPQDPYWPPASPMADFFPMLNE
jgi:hypothetical protein